MPLATATVPPTAIGTPLMAVMAWLALSKLSLALTSMVTGTSSLVVAVSAAASATAATVTVSDLITAGATPSLVLTLSVADPL